MPDPTPQWDYRPDAGDYTITTLGPDTLITEFEDRELSIREKSTVEKRVFVGRFTVTPAQWRDMVLTFKLYRYINPLTIFTFDPEADDPDLDVALVRFRPPRAVAAYVGTTLVRGTWQFREV